MDPLSITASIATLLELSNALGRYCISVSRRSKSCERLQRELNNTRVLLEHLDDNASAQHEDKQTIAAKLKAPDGPLDQLRQLLASLEKTLARCQIRSGALRWPLQEREIQTSIDLLHRLKTFFIWAQVNDSASLTNAVHSDLQEVGRDVLAFNNRLDDLQGSVKHILSGLEDQTTHKRDLQHKEILSWLCPSSVSAEQTGRYATKLREHCEGTCEWILQHPTYRNWLAGNSSASTILCSGPLGSGKSVFAAFVTHQLQQTFHRQNVVVTGLFGGSDEQYDKTCDLLSCLLHGVLCQIDMLPVAVEMSFLRHKNGRSQPGKN